MQNRFFIQFGKVKMEKFLSVLLGEKYIFEIAFCPVNNNQTEQKGWYRTRYRRFNALNELQKGSFDNE